MTRRQFARNTIGALVGASVIPAFGEKPKLVIKLPRYFIPTVNQGCSFITQEYLTKVRNALVLDTPEAIAELQSYIKEMPASQIPA